MAALTRAAVAGGIVALGLAVPAQGAVQVFDLGPERGPAAGFSAHRIGPDGAVAGTYGTTDADAARAAVWRAGTPLRRLGSTGAASGADVAADGSAIGYGVDALRWSPPRFAASAVSPPLHAPRRAGTGYGDAWLTGAGEAVLTRAEIVDGSGATSWAAIYTGWIDDERLTVRVQTPTVQDSIRVLDVAESGWIIAGFEQADVYDLGGTPTWTTAQEGYAVFEGGALRLRIPGPGVDPLGFRASLIDDRGAVYGTRDRAYGSMAPGKTTFVPLTPPDGMAATAFWLAAAAGDGILVGVTPGADGFLGSPDDESYVRRGPRARWVSLRTKLPASTVPADAGIWAFDVNPTGDVLLRVTPGGGSPAHDVVFTVRTRITGAVAVPPAAPTRAGAVKVVATSLDGLPAIAATVANGRYELLLPAGRWRLALTGAAGCAGSGACATTKTLTVDGEHDQTLSWRIDPATNPAPTTIRKGARLTARKGRVTIPVRCRLVSRRCTGTVALLPKKGARALATTALSVKPGARGTATLILPKAVKTRIAGKKTIPIRIRITTRLTTGTTTTTVAAILD